MTRSLRRFLPAAGLLAATALAAPASAAAGVVARWHMDEKSGTTMADSAGGHTGTLHSVALGQPGAWFFGTAFGFNGSSSYADVPNASSLIPGTRNVTISLRMKTSVRPPSTVEDWDLFRKGLYESGSEFKMEYYPSGQAGCSFRGSSVYTGEKPAGPVLNDNRWHTIQCFKTAPGMRTGGDGQTGYTRTGAIGSLPTTERGVNRA